jgi:endoglucanase
MRKVISILFVFCLWFAPSTKAQLPEWPKMKSLELKKVRTVSDKILVAYFFGPDMNEMATTLSGWNINGKQPGRIEKWVTPNWEGIDFGYEHHIYLSMNEPFIQGKKYSLKTPHGDTTFTFNSKEIFCESIKTNQSSYSALSKVRYANFAIWTGTGGGGKIEGELPAYEVFEIKSGKSIIKGILSELGFNANSGDFVYRIDLSSVPEGGPYKIEVKGYGCSYPFAVGGEYAKRLAYVSFRGLLYERCGIEQKQPWFDYNIREICHPTVYVTNSPYREAKVEISPNDLIIKTHGGYHDAGDADRRDHHIIAPMVLLTYYDMFPGYFSDLQYNIPDKFDADFRPVGQGNGIPDIIDEAEWGTAIFEILQEKNGGVHAGTERTGYPKDGPTLDTDTDQYATLLVRDNSTTLAAGLFAHLARAMKPFNKQRSAELKKRAEMAWAFAGDSASIPHKFYYFIQYYLLTGDQNIHRQIIELAPKISAYENTHQDNPRNIPNGKLILGAHFFSYLVQHDRPKDPGVVKIFEDVIRKVADRRVMELNENIWPNGTSEPGRWWGSQSAQGQYADPVLMQWRLTGEQKYIDAASQLMDYNQGLNPMGKSFLSGTGFDRVEDPLHHDSYQMKLNGWGPAPGLQVFGPGATRHQLKDNCPLMIPDFKTMPALRQWLDNRRNVSGNEFTIPESLSYPSVVYTILSEGGSWDRKTDLFVKITVK